LAVLRETEIDQVFKRITGCANEWFAQQVLRFSGGLTDQEHVAGAIAFEQNCLAPRLMQRAQLAVLPLLEMLGESQFG